MLYVFGNASFVFIACDLVAKWCMVLAMNQLHQPPFRCSIAPMGRALANFGLGAGVAMAAIAAISDEKGVSMLDLAAALLTIMVLGFGRLMWVRRHHHRLGDFAPRVREEDIAIVVGTSHCLTSDHALVEHNTRTIERNGRPFSAIEE